MKSEERKANLEMAEDFYATCGEILEIPHIWQKPYLKRTRWNARTLGNGRYEGFGVIRFFGPNNIHVISKKGSRHFKNIKDVYRFLKE